MSQGCFGHLNTKIKISCDMDSSDISEPVSYDDIVEVVGDGDRVVGCVATN